MQEKGNKMKLPLVSIITPSYNQGQFIEETILSVKYQDYPHIEHFVIDGGSKDSTLGILHKYSDTVRWISEPDKGFADAVNKGIRMSFGSILTILNSDDTYYCRNAIRKAVKAILNSASAGVVFGDWVTIDEVGNILDSWQGYGRRFSYSSFICSEFTFPQASAFIRRSALEAVGGQLDTNIDWCADFDLWARIGLRFPIVYIPEVLSNYRTHPGHRNADPSYASLNPRDRRRVLDKIFSMPDLPSEIQIFRNWAYAGTYLNQAGRLSRIGHIKEAERCIIRAIKLYPPYLLNKRLIQVNQNLFCAFLKSVLGEGIISYLRRQWHGIQKERMRSEQVQSSRWWE